MHAEETKIEKKPFVAYELEEERKKQDIVMLRLNKHEREQLNEVKRQLQQSKDATAYKQVFSLGYFALHDTLAGRAAQLLFKNKRNNQRSGIVEVE